MINNYCCLVNYNIITLKLTFYDKSNKPNLSPSFSQKATDSVNNNDSFIDY